MSAFDFISDQRFRNILERDQQEIDICLRNGAYKAVITLVGSLLETVLLDYLLSNLPKGLNEKKVLELDLSKMIDLVYDANLIDSKTKDLTSVVRTYRNLIHPGREIRKNETVDEEIATVAASLLKIVIREIKVHYAANYQYDAKEVLIKMDNDPSFFAIFDKVTKKMSERQRIELLNMLSNYEFTVDDEDRMLNSDQIKAYTSSLKKFVASTVIEQKLNELLKSVEVGSRAESINLMQLYGEDITILDQEKIETILSYFVNFLETSLDDYNSFEFAYDTGIFALIGKAETVLLSSKQLLPLLRKLLWQFSSADSSRAITFVYAFDDLNRFLSEVGKTKIRNYVEKNLTHFSANQLLIQYDYLNQDLPF